MAINPKYVDKGYSKGFIEAGILFLKEHFNYLNNFVYLTVEKENYQAYHAYLNSGFIVLDEKEKEILMQKSI